MQAAQVSHKPSPSREPQDTPILRDTLGCWPRHPAPMRRAGTFCGETLRLGSFFVLNFCRYSMDLTMEDENSPKFLALGWTVNHCSLYFSLVVQCILYHIILHEHIFGQQQVRITHWGVKWWKVTNKTKLQLVVEPLSFPGHISIVKLLQHLQLVIKDLKSNCLKFAGSTSN